MVYMFLNLTVDHKPNRLEFYELFPRFLTPIWTLRVHFQFPLNNGDMKSISASVLWAVSSQTLGGLLVDSKQTSSNSKQTLRRLPEDSKQILSGLQVDSVWTPSGLWVDSEWTLSGLWVDSEWTPSKWTSIAFLLLNYSLRVKYWQIKFFGNRIRISTNIFIQWINKFHPHNLDS